MTLAVMLLPSSSFVTFGDTGAGKSTLLNALIGESNILPTNGMRACTATIIESAHLPAIPVPRLALQFVSVLGPLACILRAVW